jgi:hypothetical protein
MYKMRKPLISAVAEMSGFLLVEASAPSPGEHNVFWYASLTVCGDTPCGPKKSDVWVNPNIAHFHLLTNPARQMS